MSAKLKQLGIDEEKLLAGSEEEFQKLKDAYMGIVFQLNEGNDEFLTKLRELSGYNGTAPVMLSDSNTELDTMNSELDTANQSVGNVNSSLDKTASTTGDVAANVGIVVDGLNQMPESGTVSNLAGEFDILAESIDKVAKALGLSDGAEIGTLFQAMTDLNTVTLGSETEGIIGQFNLLKKAIADVIDTIGLSQSQTVGSLMSTINELNKVSLDENIIKQFGNLKTAIDAVTSAISGGGSGADSSGSNASNSSSASMSAGTDGSGGSGSDSLTGAITGMGDTAKTVIGEPDAEGDGTVIGEFGSMETAVNDVRDAIGTEGSEGGNGGSSGETDDTLVGSIEYLGDKTEEEMGESGGDGIIARFKEFRDVIADAANQVKSISEGLDEIDGKEVECTITVNVKMNGSIPAFASGTVLGNMQIESATYNAQYGKAFASGTIGLSHAEKNALVSEYGQTEMTVLPDGKTIITDTPTLMDLPKDTVIYNEEETKKIMDNKIDVSGNAHADGTDGNWWIGADGHRYRDLQPGDRAYELQKAFEPFVDKILKGEMDIVSNAVFEGQKQMERWTKEITNNTAISNISNNNQPSVHVGDIHINCPGVTSQEVAKQVGVELNHMFSGLHLEAMQQSMMR